jgi:hypothetical protein
VPNSMSGEEGDTGARGKTGDGDRRTRESPGLFDTSGQSPLTIVGAYCFWVHRFAMTERQCVAMR